MSADLLRVAAGELGAVRRDDEVIADMRQIGVERLGGRSGPQESAFGVPGVDDGRRRPEGWGSNGTACEWLSVRRSRAVNDD
jgi:hypothetical protein